MKATLWAKLTLHIVLWGSVFFLLYSAGTRVTVSPFLTILSNREPELALPIFAQFVVTQTLSWDDSPTISHISVPMYLPEGVKSIRILLYQNDRLISTWKYPLLNENNHGIVTADLPFISPITLRGDFSLVFDGRTIAHDDKDFAPRVFTETFDAAYPNGNYRIASNEKQGDVGLQITQQKTGLDLFKEKWGDPIGATSFMLLVIAALILLGRLPSVLVDLFVPMHTGPRKKRKKVRQPKQEE